jgi:hypothetical protein
MSNTTSNPSKANTLARVQALIAGTKQHIPNGSFTFGSTVYTTASLIGLLQSLADAIAGADTAHAGTKDAVATLRAARAKVGPVLLAYRRQLLGMFSNAAQTLADFGVQPPKARTPLTSEKKAAAAAKRKATRQARGTVGKKKKLAVKGDVTGIIVTPVTNAGASTPSATAAEPASKASPPASPTK